MEIGNYIKGFILGIFLTTLLILGGYASSFIGSATGCAPLIMPVALSFYRFPKYGTCKPVDAQNLQR